MTELGYLYFRLLVINGWERRPTDVQFGINMAYEARRLWGLYGLALGSFSMEGQERANRIIRDLIEARTEHARTAATVQQAVSRFYHDYWTDFALSLTGNKKNKKPAPVPAATFLGPTGVPKTVPSAEERKNLSVGELVRKGAMLPELK